MAKRTVNLISISEAEYRKLSNTVRTLLSEVEDMRAYINLLKKDTSRATNPYTLNEDYQTREDFSLGVIASTDVMAATKNDLDSLPGNNCLIEFDPNAFAQPVYENREQGCAWPEEPNRAWYKVISPTTQPLKRGDIVSMHRDRKGQWIALPLNSMSCEALKEMFEITDDGDYVLTIQNGECTAVPIEDCPEPPPPPP